MNRRTLLSASSALILAAAARDAQAQSLTPVVAGPLSGGTDAGSIYYPMQQGWFKQAGIDLSVSPIANGAAGMSGTVGGSLNVAEANVLSLCVAHAKGIPVTIVAPGPLFDAAVPSTVKLVVMGTSDIRGPKDLAGKVVATPALGDLLWISTRAMIDQAGGDSAAVHFVELPPGSMGPALQAGRIDAAGLYDPFLSAAISAGGRSIGSPYASISSRFMIVSWFAYGPWAGAHRDALRAFGNVVARGAAYSNAHYRELLPLIAQFSHVPLESVSNVATSLIATSLDPAMIQPIINAAAKYQIIPKTFPAKELLFS